ncbi:TonB-dependent receptor domain-containing protein [Massilia sp. H6]|uniref:TonB-dependent receptor domain-containing protein n=1 Tax=Massilia sp. H6 TaxID=2970464 RepID=UPI0021690EAD|nr:TonB-dependent receptor [Massilia sp. H6]UVW29471.1 TonB-dependent receptor [Massilia sp. H6]
MSTTRSNVIFVGPRHPRMTLLAQLVAGTLLAPLAALAQQAPAPAGQPVPVESTVTVTATKATNRIDRQSYDVKADPATSNDTVADTLNKVPSVAVDGEGNVTLRGRGNVQILVDGKPSAMMQGENRAAAISALPAGDLESVEVINNPGAQFGNEGGGGPIINLVMRRERSPGGFGVVNANLGPSGRYNASSFGSYNAGRMSVQGGVFRRHDGRDASGETRRERIDPLTGAIAPSTQFSNGANTVDAAGFHGGMTYNLGDKDVVGVTLGYSQNDNHAGSTEAYRSLNSAGVVDSDYLRSSQRDSENRNFSLGTRLEHKGDRPGEVFKLDLRLSGTDADSEARYASAYTVRPINASADNSRQDARNDTRLADFTGDYELPGKHGVAKVGYKLARSRNVFDNAYFDIDPASQAERVNGARTNRFELTDTTLALYGSYQWRIDSKWGVLGGLRAEYADLDLNQVTTGERATNHYFDAIPSAFVTYGLSDDTTLRLSYAHRIRRPGASELNPFVIYRDELNVSSGNPNLKPTDSDSLELGIETKLGKVDTNVRLYARRDSELISERRLLLANDVLLTTRENAGSSRSGGLEFNFSGRATPKLMVNVNGNIGYSEQTVLGSARDDMRSATTVSGRARLSYQMDAANSFQLMLNAQGKTLFGEGYREPVRTADVNYRRALSPALSLVVNINDLFDSQKMETITETDRLREYSIRRTGGRMAYVGLSYRFGSFGSAGGQRRPMMFGGPGGHGGGPGG